MLRAFFGKATTNLGKVFLEEQDDQLGMSILFFSRAVKHYCHCADALTHVLRGTTVCLAAIFTESKDSWGMIRGY